MRKNTGLLLLSAFLFSTVAAAHIKPIVALSLGGENATFGATSTSVAFFGSPIPANIYTSTNSQDTQFLGGIFLGAECKINSLWDWQWGLSYYQNSAFQATGQVNQLGTDNLGYQYDIVSRRLLAETKLLYTIKNIIHPYVDVGVGEAFNRASNYYEYALPDSGGVPMSQPFGNHSTSNFTYIAGLGIDVDVTHYVRFGLGYRYADLGKAGLGTTPLQIYTSTIKNNSITSNTFLFQISVIC